MAREVAAREEAAREREQGGRVGGMRGDDGTGMGTGARETSGPRHGAALDSRVHHNDHPDRLAHDSWCCCRASMGRRQFRDHVRQLRDHSVDGAVSNRRIGAVALPGRKGGTVYHVESPVLGLPRP